MWMDVYLGTEPRERMCKQWLTANATVRGRGVEEVRTTSITRTGKEIHQSVSSLPKGQKSATVPDPEAGESRPLHSPHFFNIRLVLSSHHVQFCSSTFRDTIL
jgi:hypothetical protein